MAEISAKQLGLTKSNLPNSIIEVIATLTKAGFEAYIVGGGVRDTLLGLNPKDFDAVTDAKPSEIKQVFGKRCRIIGRRFQLAHVYSGREMIEVATFRAPPKGDAHTTDEGMLMRDNVWGDIHQDFARRDFSINAMYYQPLKGVVLDFSDALQDIESKSIRLLGHAPKRIEEDPVRLLRALRFKAKLGFTFNEALAEQFNEKSWGLLEQVSPHRLYDESQKMFTGGYIVPLLPLLYKYGAMQHLFTYCGDEASQLVQKVATNTDKRIAAGKSINPAFFYAALLWQNYLYQLNKFKKRNTPFAEAQSKAAKKVIERQRLTTAIPRFAEEFITEIWLLQPKLANPRNKQIMKLAEHPKFRAGFDFLLLREQASEEDTPLAESTNGMGAWWHEFQTLSDGEKKQAIDKFANQVRRGQGRRNKTQKIESPTPTQNAKPPKQATNFNRSNSNASVTPTNQTQTMQDSQEKAQLQQLSLVHLTGNSTSVNQPRQPLFVIDNIEGMNKADIAGNNGKGSDSTKPNNLKTKAVKQDAKRKTKTKKTSGNAKKSTVTVNTTALNTQPATQLQQWLLATDVPARRKRRC